MKKLIILISAIFLVSCSNVPVSVVDRAQVERDRVSNENLARKIIRDRNLEVLFYENGFYIVKEYWGGENFYIKDGVIKTYFQLSDKDYPLLVKFKKIQDDLKESKKKEEELKNRMLLTEKIKQLEKDYEAVGGDLKYQAANFKDKMCNPKRNPTAPSPLMPCTDEKLYSSYQWINLLKDEIYDIQEAKKQKINAEIARKEEIKKMEIAKKKSEIDKKNAEIEKRNIEIAREQCLSNGTIGICQSASQNNTLYMCGERTIFDLENMLNRYCYTTDTMNVYSKIEVRNNLSRKVSDMVFECEQSAKSGTILVKNSHTIYDTWLPKEVKMLQIKSIKHPQVARVVCKATNWR
jgi:hypothetical protein